MKLKIRLLYKLTQIVILFCYGIIIAAIVFPFLNLLCSFNVAKRSRDALKLHWLRLFSRILNLSITQSGSLPEQGTLLVSNHISWVDIIVLGQFLPAYFVAKSDILSWPIIGFLSRQAGTIFIRRGDKKQIKIISEKIIWALKQQGNVIAFPEGTTTQGDDVLSFHASLFQPALLAKSNIQPIAIEYLGESKQQTPFVGDDDFIPHLLKMLSLDKIEVEVTFLSQLKPAGKDRQGLSAEAREMIADVITKPVLRNSLVSVQS
jgi:1-acyl-sn-glycerol-3-phosphate acyltransferase